MRRRVIMLTLRKEAQKMTSVRRVTKMRPVEWALPRRWMRKREITVQTAAKAGEASSIASSRPHETTKKVASVLQTAAVTELTRVKQQRHDTKP